jgi:hypothetical protein
VRAEARDRFPPPVPTIRDLNPSRSVPRGTGPQRGGDKILHAIAIRYIIQVRNQIRNS